MSSGEQHGPKTVKILMPKTADPWKTCTLGEILEVNQVVSYFNYVNRMVVGLGVDTVGDIIGLSPNNNDETNNWSHT